MRLIDAEELLEHLEACLQNGRHLSNLYDLSEIVRYVKSMPSIASPWHRVEEKPKQNGAFAVACVYDGKLYWYKGIYLGGKWLREGVGIEMPADYWMPIEPPKEECNAD